MDLLELREMIRETANEAEEWDGQASTFPDLSDGELAAARDALRRLAERLEPLVAAAEEAAPDDLALVSAAHIALRKARHGAVWAGYVIHQRLPRTDLSDLV